MSRDLRLVGISLLIWGIGEGMFFYFQPLYIQQLGADPVQIGTILGAAGLAMAVAHMPAGALADTLGRKTMMAASWIVGMLSAWMMFLAVSLPAFVLGLLIYSLTAFVMSPMASYVTEARGEWPVARALTTTSAFFNLGAALGPLLGGALAERFGLRVVYGVAAALFVPSTALILAIRRQPREPHDGDSRYRGLLRRGEFLAFLLLSFAVMFGLYLSWPLTPNYLHSVRQISLSQIGILGSVNALGVVGLNLILGRAGPRLGYLVSQAGIGVSVVLLWLATGVPWLALGYFLAGGMRTARSMVTAQVDRLVRRSEMGLAYGMAETAQSAALVVAPVLAGILYEVDPALPFPLALGLIAVMWVVTWRLAPREEAQVPSPTSSAAPPSAPQTIREELP
jgi:MFS family permease